MVQQKLNTSEDEHGNRLQEKDNSIFKNQKKNIKVTSSITIHISIHFCIMFWQSKGHNSYMIKLHIHMMEIYFIIIDMVSGDKWRGDIYFSSLKQQIL
jgi:hypothetical protein